MSSSKTSSSASKSNKKKIEKLPKYASKYLDKVLTDLIKQRVPVLQQPKSTEKWLAKVKLHILRKVSQSSKILFAKDNFQSSEELKKDIKDLKEKIRIQTISIKKASIKLKGNTNIAQINVPTENLQNYKLGVLDPKAREICENFKEVAATLTQLDKEIHPQLESLNKTVQSIKPQVNQLLESYRKNNPVAASVSSNQSSSKSSTKKDNKSRKAPPTAVKAPIQRFNELLDKN